MADSVIEAEIAVCFIDVDGRRTDTIVLACTHYPLLLERIRSNAPWPVTWLDHAPAIARRVADLMHERTAAENPPLPKFEFTSGRPLSPELTAALGRYGF